MIQPLLVHDLKLIKSQELSEEELAENVNSISAEIDNAFKFAKESPFADQHILDEHIYK